MALIETLKKRVAEWQRNNPLEYQQFTNEGWLFDMSKEHVIDIFNTPTAECIVIKFDGIGISMDYQYNGIACRYKLLKTKDKYAEFYLSDGSIFHDEFFKQYFSIDLFKKFKSTLDIEIQNNGKVITFSTETT